MIFRNKVSGVTWTIFFFGVVSIFYPLYLFFIDTFKDCIKSDNVASMEKNFEVDYDEMRMFFLNEYDRANPITQEQGMADYMNYMKGRMIITPAKASDAKGQQAMNQMRNTFMMGQQRNAGNSYFETAGTGLFSKFAGSDAGHFGDVHMGGNFMFGAHNGGMMDPFGGVGMMGPTSFPNNSMFGAGPMMGMMDPMAGGIPQQGWGSPATADPWMPQNNYGPGVGNQNPELNYGMGTNLNQQPGYGNPMGSQFGQGGPSYVDPNSDWNLNSNQGVNDPWNGGQPNIHSNADPNQYGYNPNMNGPQVSINPGMGYDPNMGMGMNQGGMGYDPNMTMNQGGMGYDPNMGMGMNPGIGMNQGGMGYDPNMGMGMNQGMGNDPNMGMGMNYNNSMGQYNHSGVDLNSNNSPTKSKKGEKKGGIGANKVKPAN